MRYLTKNQKGVTIHLASIHDITAKMDKTNVFVESSKKALREAIKKQIKDSLKKNHHIAWNKDTKHEVNMFRVKEYDELNEELSEFITEYTVTTIGCIGEKKVIRHKISRVRNPSFVDNPECEFCYKKTTKLYNAQLLDAKKTKRRVCHKCKKKIAKWKKTWIAIQYKK